MVYPLVIMTVPHEECDDEFTNHDCDPWAILIAQRLYNNLYNRVIFHGDINRRYIDLNRIPSRFRTAFRNKIRQFTFEYLKAIIQNMIANKKITYKTIFAIDCHSYPRFGFSKANIKDPDVTILYDNTNYIDYLKLLVKMLNDNKIIAIMLPGVHNDIMDEFNDIQENFNTIMFGIRIIALLLEVNEKLDANKLNIISNTVTDWIDTVDKNIEQKVRKRYRLTN